MLRHKSYRWVSFGRGGIDFRLHRRPLPKWMSMYLALPLTLVAIFCLFTEICNSSVAVIVNIFKGTTERFKTEPFFPDFSS